MDRSVGSPRTRSVVGVRGPGVSVFGLPTGDMLMKGEHVAVTVFLELHARFG